MESPPFEAMPSDSVSLKSSSSLEWLLFFAANSAGPGLFVVPELEKNQLLTPVVALAGFTFDDTDVVRVGSGAERLVWKKVSFGMR